MSAAVEVEKPSAAGEITELSVSGMSCGNCARHVSEALQEVPGVAHALVTLETNRATVKWHPGAETNVGALLRALQQAGYPAEPSHDHGAAHTHKGADSLWGVNLLTGIIPTAVLMAGEWIFRLQGEPWFRWLSFILALIVQAGPGSHFYRGAWRQFKVGSSNMDTLVALGSTTAFLYSTWVLFSGSVAHLYFMEAAAIITLISAGHWIEARTSARASTALRELLNLAPATARKIVNGIESEVPVSDLRANDAIVLRPGDRVPADGEVIEGASAVDESMLTGESLPVEKSPGSKVYTGTINTNGRLLIRVIGTGEETALAHIIEAVERAQSSRAQIQRLGDQISSVFVPVVVMIALAAGLWWGLAPHNARFFHDALAGLLWHANPPPGNLAAAFIVASAVLIIACPCAMGLATPAAIMAGANAAAKRGILIRDAIALEKAGQITAVVFDKTGTLTRGKPEVAAFESLASFASQPAREIAAAMAHKSNHPLSQAVARIGPDRIALSEWREIRGSGVEAKLDGSTLRLGSIAWLREAGVDFAKANGLIEKWSGEGATVLGLAAGQNLIGLAGVRDGLKPRAREVIEHLDGRRLKTYLLTGDNPQTARAIAASVGIKPEHVFAEVRPEKKAEFIRDLQASEKVAFVGDGINDAPALEQADLGIAVARASDIAREAADIILLKSEIEAVPESIGLARATLRTIKQNLFWAFFYNAVGIPLAALGFMSPVLCAAAMGLSDVVVIGNALRLMRWRSAHYQSATQSALQ